VLTDAADAPFILAACSAMSRTALGMRGAGLSNSSARRSAGWARHSPGSC
jgi:hypothetical protein